MKKMSDEKKLALAKKVTLEELQELASKGIKGIKETEKKETTEKETKEKEENEKVIELKEKIKNLQEEIEKEENEKEKEELKKEKTKAEMTLYQYEMLLEVEKEENEQVKIEMYDFEIKSTNDLVKANSLKDGKKIRFVDKLPLARLLYRQDIREFIQEWNDKFQEKTISSNSNINIDKILEDKILLKETELLLERQEVEYINCQDTRAIEKANEKLTDIKSTIQKLKKDVKDGERKASIIRREKLLNDLKSSIGYKY